MDWSSEFSELDFGEKRLNRRFLKTIQLFSQRPGDTIAGACRNWAQTKGAYRLLGHRRFDREHVLELHQEKTFQRMKEHRVVLAIQDTSVLNYQTHLNTKDLGVTVKTNSKSRQGKGLFMHSLIAVTPEMEPLGLLDHRTWARVPKSERDLQNYEKESLKWLKSLEKGSVSAQAQLPHTQVITVSDRESDINIYLGGAFESGVDIIVRAMNHRVDGVNGKTIGESTLEMPVLGEYDLELAQRQVSSASNYRRKNVQLSKPIRRTAHVEVRVAPVLIKVVGASKKVDVPYNCIYIKEQGSTREKTIDWLLLTSLEVKSFADAQKVVSYYKARWFIEIFHRTLKSGCGIEESRLQYAERLRNYILLMSLAALQICQLTYLQRNHPDESCLKVLSSTQWKALFLYYNFKAKLPKSPPDIQTVSTWIARLGGFLARRNDGYPGTLTMWKGWLRMNDVHESFLRFSAETCG
jgi:hypothetical protein